MSRPSLLDKLRGMNQRSLFGPGSLGKTASSAASGDDEENVPAAGQARAEAVQRLQVGLAGIGAMVLLVGLASIIGGQADLTDELAVPEAAPTTEPMPEPAQANPLADAGVVPDIASEPSAPATLSSPTDPGNATPAR